MAFSFVNAAFVKETANSTSHSITVPTGVVVGDLLVLAALVGQTLGTTLAAPAGWTTIDGNRDMGGNSNPSASLFYKIATASEVAGSTITWSSGTGSQFGFSLLGAWRGVDQVAPFVGFAVGITATASGSHPVDASAITVADNGSLVVSVSLSKIDAGASTNTTPPSGFTEAVDSLPGAGLGGEASYETVNAGASLGTVTATTTTGTVRSIDYVVVFKQNVPAGALTGSASATASASGTLAGAAHLTGAATAAGSGSGTLKGAGALSGSGNGSSDASGVFRPMALIGSTDATSDATGQATGAAALVGSTAALSDAFATLSRTAQLIGSALATSDAWGYVYGSYPPRISSTFIERWQSGEHIGDARPQLKVLIRQGRLNRRYGHWDDNGFPIDAVIGQSDPLNPWQAYWEPTEPYTEVPNVNSVELANNFDQKGIASAVLTVDNIVYLEEAGGQHSVNRGYLAPLRGYVADGRTPLVDESGATVAENEWLGKFSQKYQVTVFEGYGDEMVKTFTGLIDEVDATSNPAVLTINARSFGQIVSDQEFFGWSIDKDLRDPVVFIDKDQADNIRKGGYSPDASSQDTANGFTADKVNDGDSNTYWRSNDHTAAGNTEWVEIEVGEGRYSDFWLGAEYPDMDCYISVFPRALADGSNPTLAGGDLAPDAWVDLSVGTVPGTFGGIPYIRLISGMDADVSVRDLNDPAGAYPDGEFAMGDGSKIRVSFRGLFDLGAEGFRAAVRSLYSRKRTLVNEAGANKWVRVGDISDVIKVVLRWAGFKEWDIESTGARLNKRLLANRGMKYMDLIDAVKDGVGYEFFVADPSPADESIGVPVFRQSRIVQPATVPIFTVTDRDLLTAVSLKDADENKAYIIRTRGRTSKTGDPLGGDQTRRIMFEYRPPWSGLPMAGILRHVIHTNEKFTTADDLKFAAWFIALQEAIESYGVDCEIPGYPGVNLDDLFILEDLGTGLTTRVSVRERRSTSTAGESRAWTMTLTGALVDVPDVQDVVAVIDAAAKGEE